MTASFVRGFMLGIPLSFIVWPLAIAIAFFLDEVKDEGEENYDEWP